MNTVGKPFLYPISFPHEKYSASKRLTADPEKIRMFTKVSNIKNLILMMFIQNTQIQNQSRFASISYPGTLILHTVCSM